MSATEPTYPLLGKRVRILATLLPDFYGTVERVRIFPKTGLFTYCVRLDEPSDCVREFRPDQLEEVATMKHYTCHLCGVATVATAEDVCEQCAHEEYLFMLLVLVRAGDITDWSPCSWNHVRHMTDEHEGKGGNWRAQLETMLDVLLPMLEDGAGYGE